MGVIDLLIDHPATPQWLSFETLLPNLMSVTSYWKLESLGSLNNGLGCFAFQVATELDDFSIARIGNEVKVIGHQDVGDEFGGPLFLKCFQFS